MPSCLACGSSIPATSISCPKCGRSISSQPAVKLPKQQIGEKAVVRVFLLDNSFQAVLASSDTLCETIVRTMTEKVGIKNPSVMYRYFGLYESIEGSNIGRMVGFNEKVVEIQEKWAQGSQTFFIFKVKLYMKGLLTSEDEKVIDMIYLDQVYNVNHSTYSVDMNDAINLAAIQMMVQFGAYSEEKHKKGYLAGKLISFVPYELLKKLKTEQWETKILEQYKSSCNTNSANERTIMKQNYINLCKKFDMFGRAFFVCDQFQFKNFKKTVLVGLCFEGISLYQIPEKKLLMSWRLQQVFRWSFRLNDCFSFEVKTADGEHSVYELKTVEGERMSDLLACYAQTFLYEFGGSMSKEDEAALSIQAVFRGHQIRKKMTGGKGKRIIMLQSLIRRFLARRKFKKEKSALFIQKVYRGHVARKQYEEIIVALEAELAA